MSSKNKTFLLISVVRLLSPTISPCPSVETSMDSIGLVGEPVEPHQPTKVAKLRD